MNKLIVLSAFVSLLALMSCRNEADYRAKYLEDIKLENSYYTNQFDTLGRLSDKISGLEKLSNESLAQEAKKTYKIVQDLFAKVGMPRAIGDAVSIDEIDNYYEEQKQLTEKKKNYEKARNELLQFLKETRSAMRKDVMDIHDYAMAKMGMLTEMELKISSEIDSSNNVLLNEATFKIKALRQADEDMMDWMRQYKDPLEETALDSVKRYFDKQKISIEKVKKDTDLSIKEAEFFLKKIN